MNRTILGIERIDEYKDFFEGKRIGLITNPTGIDGEFRSSIDILQKKANLVALYSPEHGVRASIQAGQHLDTYIYDETGMQPCLYHVESMSNNGKISNELDLTDYLNGDANCDNIQSMADAAAILQAIGNPDKYALSDLGEFNADYACDGLTADDAIAIQKKLAGITEQKHKYKTKGSEIAPF